MGGRRIRAAADAVVNDYRMKCHNSYRMKCPEKASPIRLPICTWFDSREDQHVLLMMLFLRERGEMTDSCFAYSMSDYLPRTVRTYNCRHLMVAEHSICNWRCNSVYFREGLGMTGVEKIFRACRLSFMLKKKNLWSADRRLAIFGTFRAWQKYGTSLESDL